MLRDQFQYAIELERRDHTRLAQVPVTMDWGPALEWARFKALRESAVLPKPALGGATVEPDWDVVLGEPYVGGVRIRLEADGATPPALLSRAYFNRAAIEASKGLVARGLLEPKEKFVYTVVAFRSTKQERPRTGLSLTVEAAAPSYALKSASCRSLRSGASVFGEVREEDARVFMPMRVLEQAGELTRAAAATEAAGILIGHVCRDPENLEVFLEVTELIPAKHTRSERTQVTLTPETWSAVDAALGLRHAGEIMVGWFHSHPVKYWCSENCAPEVRRSCPLARSFFSGEDCALHRTVFPMAHCVALLATNAEAGLRHALFGWRQGLIVQRGFHVLNAEPGLKESASTEAIIGENHEEVCA